MSIGDSVTVEDGVRQFISFSSEGFLKDYSSIAQLASKYGVTLRTLRFYEDRGFLAPIRKGSARFYSSRDDTMLSVILKGKRLGLSLAQIANIIAANTSESKLKDASKESVCLLLTPEQLNLQINQLEKEKARVQCSLEDLYLMRDQL